MSEDQQITEHAHGAEGPSFTSSASFMWGEDKLQLTCLIRYQARLHRWTDTHTRTSAEINSRSEGTKHPEVFHSCKGVHWHVGSDNWSFLFPPWTERTWAVWQQTVPTTGNPKEAANYTCLNETVACVQQQATQRQLSINHWWIHTQIHMWHPHPTPPPLHFLPWPSSGWDEKPPSLEVMHVDLIMIKTRSHRNYNMQSRDHMLQKAWNTWEALF